MRRRTTWLSALGLDVDVARRGCRRRSAAGSPPPGRRLVGGVQLLVAARARPAARSWRAAAPPREVVRRPGQGPLEAVDVGDGLEDVRLGREHRLDGHARPGAAGSRRARGRTGWPPPPPAARLAVALQREQHVLLREGLGHRPRGQRHVQLQRVNLPVAHAGRRGDGLGDPVLVQRPPSGQRDLEGGHHLHRRDGVARLVLVRAHLLQHPGPRGLLLGAHVLGLARRQELCLDQRIEDEAQREVGAGARHGGLGHGARPESTPRWPAPPLPPTPGGLAPRRSPPVPSPSPGAPPPWWAPPRPP